MPRQGSLWVEGNYIHFIDSSEDEWRFLGDTVGTPSGARQGSIWLEGDYWHYIDSSGVERRMPGIFIYNHSAGFGDPGYTGARKGSIWLEDTQHTDGTVHNDTPHGDLPAGNHTDSTYGSPAHTDSPNAFHQNYPAYTQSHVDTTPSNAWTKPLLHYIEEDTDERGAHLDTTTNQGHGDHSDSSAWHLDTAQVNHTDVNLPNHGNTPGESSHTNTHSNVTPMPGPGHTNTSHGDSSPPSSHVNSHNDHEDINHPGHSNTPAYSDHDDVHGNSTTMGGVHTDSDTAGTHVNHTDNVNFGNTPGHTDSHSDIPHTNNPHGNSPLHSDTGYSDHTDTSHSNVNSHTNVPHDNQSYAVSHEDDSHGDGHTDWPATV